MYIIVLVSVDENWIDIYIYIYIYMVISIYIWLLSELIYTLKRQKHIYIYIYKKL